jgi:hypothetical protein
LQRIPVVKGYDPGPCKKKTHGKEVLVKIELMKKKSLSV